MIDWKDLFHSRLFLFEVLFTAKNLAHIYKRDPVLGYIDRMRYGHPEIKRTLLL
jgi:hypothetical protein